MKTIDFNRAKIKKEAEKHKNYFSAKVTCYADSEEGDTLLDGHGFSPIDVLCVYMKLDHVKKEILENFPEVKEILECLKKAGIDADHIEDEDTELFDTKLELLQKVVERRSKNEKFKGDNE